jgi:hypothetical protein
VITGDRLGVGDAAARAYSARFRDRFTDPNTLCALAQERFRACIALARRRAVRVRGSMTMT